MTDIAKRIAGLSPEKRKLLMERLNRKNGSRGSRQIVPRGRETNKFVLSFAQQRLWFLDQLDPETYTWNIPLVIRISGNLNIEAFGRALEEIVDRHEVLRTTFAIENGEPVQVIGARGDVALPVVDLSDLSSTERTSEFKRLALKEAQRSFDLSAGPLMRTTLLKIGDREYIFMLTMHHIVSDAWSMGVFFREFSALYKAFSRGQRSPLTPLEVQYADFAVWQREWLQGEQLKQHMDYWKAHLAGAPQALDLPTDHPRPAVQTFPGEVEFLKSGKDLLDALKKLSQQANATLFMTLIAAFKALLHRYTGQDDIVIGTPIAGRNRSETEALIGFFINNLVMRTDMRGNPTFRELLARVRETSLGAFAHQDLPFEKLVEELQPDRNLSMSPLFQVMFILQNAPMDEVDLAGLTLSPVVFRNYKTSRFDLSIYMGEQDEDKLLAAFEYNTDLFEAGTIRRMVGHFEALLKGIVENPDARLSELPLLMQSERQKMLVDWNDTAAEVSGEDCFHRLFESQADRTPDAVAVVFEDEEISYRELNSRSNQLARRLLKLGVGPDVFVGICLQRSIDMVVSLLAVQKAGGAYVPVDPAYPAERIAYMLEDAGVAVVLTQSALKAALPSLSAEALCVDKVRAEIEAESSENPVSPVDGGNLAYVIYTSGSTGKPKGVAIQHHNLVNFISSMADVPGLSPQDTLVAVTTLSFDIAGLELYLPLSVGARVVLASRDVAADGRMLSKLLETSGATVAQATPATWMMLIEAGWEGAGRLKALCGGEALPRELANSLAEKGASLWNMYGPTETTIWSAVRQVEVGDGVVPIGHPIANTQIYIVDRDFNPVPIGVHGELLIGGAGLARGYLNQPELTADKFVPNPFSDTPGARLYRTGDLARFLVDGSIEFISRIDHQVKLRGFRIELGEIEAVLSHCKGVAQAAVVVREDNPGDKRLVAYIVAQDGPAPVAEALRTRLREHLPDYMVPSGFVFLDSFPLTPNGKLDRRALPAPEAMKSEPKGDYKPPHNEVERMIASVWQEVLHVEKVGVNDNFFDLGGHSLLLVRIQSRLCDLFERELSIIELFKYPTVKMLGNYFSQEGGEEQALGRVQQTAKKRKAAIEKQKQRMQEAKKKDGELDYA